MYLSFVRSREKNEGHFSRTLQRWRC